MNGACEDCGFPTDQLWCYACAAKRAQELRDQGVLVVIDGQKVYVPAQVQRREKLTSVPRRGDRCPSCARRLTTYDGGKTWGCLFCGYRDDP